MQKKPEKIDQPILRSQVAHAEKIWWVNEQTEPDSQGSKFVGFEEHDKSFVIRLNKISDKTQLYNA